MTMQLPPYVRVKSGFAARFGRPVQNPHDQYGDMAAREPQGTLGPPLHQDHEGLRGSVCICRFRRKKESEIQGLL